MRRRDVPENGSAGRPTRGRRFWEEHRHLIQFIGVITAIVTLVVTVWAFTRNSGDPAINTQPPGGAVSPAPAPDPPKNVIEQVEQRPFWVRPPQIYESAGDVLDSKSDPFSAVGGPTVLDARELADDAVSWEDQTVYVVGLVVRQRSVEEVDDLDVLFSLNTEYQLAPVRGITMYVGESHSFSLELPIPVPDEGDVIYASGKLAAVGEARELGGRVMAAVYFVADEVGSYEPGKDTIDSKALEKALMAGL